MSLTQEFFFIFRGKPKEKLSKENVSSFLSFLSLFLIKASPINANNGCLNIGDYLSIRPRWKISQQMKVFISKIPMLQTTVDSMWYWTWPNSCTCPQKDHGLKLFLSVVSAVFTVILYGFLSCFRVLIWFHLVFGFFLRERWHWPWVNNFPQ